MVVALALLVLGLVGGLALTWYRPRVGMLDAMALAAKTAVPRPRSALDWPEVRLDTVVRSPDRGDFLVVALWPAHPGRRSMLVLRVEGPDRFAGDRLVRWCRQRVSLSIIRSERRRRAAPTQIA